jgi:type II secretory pathway component GspD/PulD (secretin)
VTGHSATAASRRRAWLAAALLLTTPAVAADYPLTILELKHRLPAELIAQLTPLAGPDGVVTGANDVLLVRVSPARLADIRRALAELDRPIRNLLVEVRSANAGTAHERGIAVGVDERIGDPRGNHGRVVLGPGGGTGIAVRERSLRQDDRVLQRVRVLDGGSAQIQVGSLTPVPVRERWRSPTGDWQRQTVTGVETGTGFWVTPRVVGDRVVVDIDQQSTAWRRGTVTGGGVQTQVSGPLGAWLPLGGSEGAQGGTSRNVTGAGSASAEATFSLQLRVTVVD